MVTGKINEKEKDRYYRIYSINTFGYDIPWEDLRTKKIVIAGVGGLGTIGADMFARCGVGTLYLFDMDIVEELNLNRLGFTIDDVGRPKVDVIAERIKRINPDIDVKAFHGDIMWFENEENFEQRVAESDLVFMGLDNYPARMFVNQKCVSTRTPLMDGGASRSALSGNIQLIIPGKTACYACRGKNLATEKREKGERCTASLPTTMAIIASLQVMESLKFLLGFGTNVQYLTYNALTGEFREYKPKRDPNCPICNHLKTNEN
ncbi:MAG: HesA/MoeB/ThiF family protein [Promethearchaeota archaeon]